MNTTLKDLLHAINILGQDQDIFVDGIGSIAVCPPVKITPEGQRHFSPALDANVVVIYHNCQHRHTFVSDPEETTDRQAYDFLNALTGNCPNSLFTQWFEGEDSQII